MVPRAAPHLHFLHQIPLAWQVPAPDRFLPWADGSSGNADPNTPTPEHERRLSTDVHICTRAEKQAEARTRPPNHVKHSLTSWTSFPRMTICQPPGAREAPFWQIFCSPITTHVMELDTVHADHERMCSPERLARWCVRRRLGTLSVSCPVPRHILSRSDRPMVCRDPPRTYIRPRAKACPASVRRLRLPPTSQYAIVYPRGGLDR
jgi:hypothetical protein